MPLLSFFTTRWQKHGFLFTELVKRDFKNRYKRAVLGIVWSMLGPMLQLMVMALVFTHIIGRDIPHFIIFLFCGNLTFAFFRQATFDGMASLMGNAGIITKINVPKYIFLLSKNVAALINFGLIFLIFLGFVAASELPFHPRFFLLVYPILCLVVFNIGVGLVLSAMFVFFRDTQYLYEIFTMLLMWLSAIFYTVDHFPVTVQRLFWLNPLYTVILYIRNVVIGGIVPSLNLHIAIGFYALAALAVGGWIYRRYNYRFIFYM